MTLPEYIVFPSLCNYFIVVLEGSEFLLTSVSFGSYAK